MIVIFVQKIDWNCHKKSCRLVVATVYTETTISDKDKKQNELEKTVEAAAIDVDMHPISKSTKNKNFEEEWNNNWKSIKQQSAKGSRKK